MLKTVPGPDDRRFKMGRKPPRPGALKLSMHNYLLKSFPTPPSSVDYRAKAAQYLANVYGNENSGDCTCAGAYHSAAVILANSHKPVPFRSDDVVAFYKMMSGWNGIENDPSDTGLNCQDVLNWWKHHGLPPDNNTVIGWVTVNANDPLETRVAMWLFENLYFGVPLCQEWQDGMQELTDGFVWDVGGPPDLMAGHCFVGTGYDETGVIIDTWGLTGALTWAAVSKYAGRPGGELYAVLDDDIIDRATQRSPAGFNLSQLLSDFQSVGGSP
jgi:hypothetical protein